MNFLYFVPGVTRQTLGRDLLVAAGLGDVLRDRLTPNDLAGIGGLALAEVQHGPDGHSGVILYPMTDDERAGGEEMPPLVIGYYKGSQEWEPFGGYYVGWVPDDLPTPEGLEREQSLRGYPEILGDGREWICPLIRMEHGQHNLPDVWGIRQGKFSAWVKPDWAWAWDLTGEIWDYFSKQKDIPNALAFEWVVKLLSINYRVGPIEVTALKLFGRDEYRVVLEAAIHGPLIERIRGTQKKISETSAGTAVNSSPGAEV